MSGLVRKDFYVVKSMGRSYLFMFGVFAFLSMMGVYDGVAFLSFLAVMMLILLPINTFAYDEQSGWEKLAAATPAGRRGVVGAKYLFTVLLLAVGLALCAGIQASMYAFGIHGDGTLGEGLESAMITVCAGGILNAILLPLIFRFGTQKSRIFFMIAMGVGTAGVVILMGVTAATETGIAWLTGAAALLMPVAAAAALMVSYAVSLQIYGKKEL